MDPPVAPASSASDRAAVAPTRARTRWLIALCAGGSSAFLACIAYAAARYPGGTWFDPHARGHSLARNFLCDLMQTRALNGDDASAGSRVARLGTLGILAALAAFFTLVAGLEARPSRAGRVARAAGLATALLGCAVPLTPSDRGREAHLAAVLCAFAASLVATVAAVRISLRLPARSRWIKGAALLTLGAGALDGLGYAFGYGAYYARIRVPRMDLVQAALPLLQRVALAGLLAWMLAVCVYTGRRGRGAGGVVKHPEQGAAT